MKKKFILRILAALFLIAGIVIALYPVYSSSLNALIDQRIMRESQDIINKNSKKLQQQMKAQNEKLKQSGIAANQDILDLKMVKSDTKMKQSLIGEVVIPKLKLTTPLFKDMNDQLLGMGASVVPGTSMPVGGADTHTVIAGHRGMMEHRIFTELNKLKKGDLFILKVFNKNYAYQVKQIQTVEPSNIAALKIEPGKDLATLLTCTPLMINSHRLLVTGERVPYTEKVATKINKAQKNEVKRQLALLIGSIIIILVVAGLLIRWIVQNRRRKQQEKGEV